MMKWVFLLLLISFSRPAFAGYTTPMETVKTEGGKMSADFGIHVQGHSEKGVILILGGGPGFSSWNLEPIQSELSQFGFKVILMDMWGIGENRHIQPKPILNSWVQQIDQVLSQQAISGDLHLIGHSWGALMALIYARDGQYRQRIDKSILLNPVDPEKKSLTHLAEQIHRVNQRHKRQSWQAEQQWQQVFDKSLSDLTTNQLTQALPAYFYDYQQGQNYARQFDPSDFDIDLNVRAWQEYDANRIHYHQINDRIQYYFLGCQEDLLMPQNYAEMSNNMTFEKEIILKQCKHFPWVETEESFFRQLKSFL